MERNDPPRPMRNKSKEVIMAYLEQAVRMYDHFVENERIQNRIYTIDNSKTDDKGIEKITEQIARYILTKQCASELV